MKYLIFLTLIAGIANSGQTANILAMLPFPFYSHYTGFMAIFKELAARGHNVTVVSSYPQKTPVPNLTDVVVPSVLDDMKAILPEDQLEMSSYWFLMTKIWKEALFIDELVLNTEPVKRFIADQDSRFDLVMTETWCYHEPMVAFGHKFNAPVINLLSLTFLPLAAYTSGNDMPTSYVPVNLYYGYNDRMSFLERVQNTFFYYWQIVYPHFFLYRKQDELMRKYFKYPGSENLPPLDDMLRNTSLTIMEHDLAVGYPIPLHKNVVLFAGAALKEPERLPDELQKYMDENKEGVIYFSMGSYFSMDALKPYMNEAIISALNKLNYKVLMKADKSLAANFTNKNIMIKSWLPQRAVLAHPNCKLFITHGGIHGTLEGFYYGVPMVAIPLISDQRYNAKMTESHGLGLSVDIFSITESKVTKAINEVLGNPKYRENARKRSAIFKDTPINPMDNVIYWIEYVIRHKGAPHLRPAVLDLYWYQRLMLDVIAFYLLIIVFIIYIVKIILHSVLKCFTKYICKKRCKKSKKE